MSILCLAFTHMEVENYKKAYDYLIKAEKLSGNSNNKLINNINANLGIVNYHLKEYDKSIVFFKKAISYYQSNNNFYGSSIIYHGLAFSYHKLNNIDRAIEYELIALKHQEKSESVFALAMIANNLEELYLEKGDMNLSKKYFEIGGKEAYKLNSPNFKLEYLKGMLKSYKANSKFENALQFSEKYIQLKDSLYSIDSTKTSLEIEERFQSKLKNKEIELLKTQKKLVDITITEEELKSLEAILFSNKIQKEQVEKEIGHRLDLVAFIVSLIGLSSEKVNGAFADFINKYQLTAVQIQFLDTIKLFLTNNGKIDPSKLYDSPFKNYHSLGIDGVFNEEQSTNIFNIIENFNKQTSGN